MFIFKSPHPRTKLKNIFKNAKTSSTQKIEFKKSGIRLKKKSTRYTKKQENMSHNEEKKKSVD